MEQMMMDAAVQMSGLRAAGQLMGAAQTDSGVQGLFAALFGQMLEQTGQSADELLAGLLAAGGKKKDEEQNLAGMELLAQSLFVPQAFGLQEQPMAAMGMQELLAALPDGTDAANAAQTAPVMQAAQMLDAAPQENERSTRGEDWDALLETLTAAWEKADGTAQETSVPPAQGLAEQLRFQAAVRQTRETMAARPREQRQEGAEGGLDVEALQAAVNSRQYVPDTASAQRQTADIREIADQLKTGILDNVRQGREEFVVKLKPAGLGEITVKLSEAKDGISLRIVTSSAAVGRMIANEVNALQNALRPLRAQVQEIVTVPPAAENAAAQTAWAGEQSGQRFAWHNNQQNGGYHAQTDDGDDFESVMETAAPDDASVNLLI